MQIVPSASNQFKKTDMAVLYVEVYEPLLKTDKPPVVVVKYRVLERKSGEVKVDTGLMNVAPYSRWRSGDSRRTEISDGQFGTR